MSSRTALSGKMFQESLKAIAYTIVWKDHGSAVAYESLCDPTEVDAYMSASTVLQGYYSTSELVAIYHATDAQFQKYYAEAPDNLKYYLNTFKNYVEKNTYYRLISGYPPYGVQGRDVYVKDVEGIDPNTPVYNLSWSDKLKLDTIGRLDSLYESTGFRYLKYMTTRCICPFIGRMADKFSILYIDNSNPEGMLDDFKKIYNRCRDYMISNHYSDAFRNVNDYYDGFIGMAILFMAITEMHYKYLETDIDRNFYDLDSIKIVYDAYGVPFVEEIPLKYHQKIVKNINKLIGYKGSNRVLSYICDLFDYNTMELHNYYLVKRHRTLDGNPIFEYDEQGKLKRTCFDIFFAKCRIGDDPYLAITDDTNHLTYENVTAEDPYWITDDELLTLIYDSQYDYAETKYIGAHMVFNNTQLLFETAYFAKMLFDNKDKMNNIFITHEYLGQKVSLFSLILYIYAAICEKHEWEGTIPSNPEGIDKVFGFNYQEDLSALITEIIDDPDIENQLAVLLNKIKTDVYSDISNTYSVLLTLTQFFEGMLTTVRKKDVFYKYKKLRKLLMTTKLINECFQTTEGVQATTYKQLLESYDIGLYSRLIDENIDLQEDIDYALSMLKKMSYDLEFIEYIDGIDSEKISEYLYRLINFFKSSMAQMAQISIVFLINPLDNMIKFMDTCTMTDIGVLGPLKDESLTLEESIFKVISNQASTPIKGGVTNLDDMIIKSWGSLLFKDKPLTIDDSIRLYSIRYPENFAYVSDIPFWDTINKVTKTGIVSEKINMEFSDSLFKQSEVISPGTYLTGNLSLVNAKQTLNFYQSNPLTNVNMNFSNTLDGGSWFVYRKFNSKTGLDEIKVDPYSSDPANNISIEMPFISSGDVSGYEFSSSDSSIIPALELNAITGKDSSLTGLLLFSGNDFSQYVDSDLNSNVKETWTNSGNLNTARYALAGCGLQSAGLSFGGYTGALSAVSEKFNGSTWTTTGNLNTARWGLAGCGTQSAGLSFGGNTALSITEIFNGSTWTTTGNLNTARQSLAGCGTQSAGLSFGGYTTTFVANTEKFNGFTWSNTGNLNTVKNLLAGCGIQSAGLSFGGNPTTATSEKFNGSTWAATGNMNTSRSELGGCGIQSAGLSLGGHVGSNFSAVTEKFDIKIGLEVTDTFNSNIILNSTVNDVNTSITGSGKFTLVNPYDMNLYIGRKDSDGSIAYTLFDSDTLNYDVGYIPKDYNQNFGVYLKTELKSPHLFKMDGFANTLTAGKFWTYTGNLNTARYYIAGCGSQLAGLSFGGYSTTYSAVTEKFDGSIWASSGNLNTARHALAGCGTQSSGLSFGGNAPYVITEKFDGSIWTSSGNLNTARSALAGCGTQSSGLSFGGNAGSSILSVTEKFNGLTWSNTGNLINARNMLAGCGSQSAGLSFGGQNSNAYTVTEKFNGDVWAASGNMNVARSHLTGCGVQSSALGYGGYNGIYALVFTEEFNDSVWVGSTDLNMARQALAGCGIQSAGLSFGGGNGNVLSYTEYFSEIEISKINNNISVFDDNWETILSDPGHYFDNTETFIEILPNLSQKCSALVFDVKGAFNVTKNNDEYTKNVTDNSKINFNFRLIDPSNFMNNIWSNAGNLSAGRFGLAGCGTQSAGLSFGGAPSGTEKFNGSIWSTTGNLNISRYNLAGCGIQSSGLSFGGSGPSSTTEKFDGSVWTSSGNLNTARYGLAGCGIQSAALSFGGCNTDYLTVTEKFNGSTWSASVNLSVSTQFLAACGTQYAVLSFGGDAQSNHTEKFNGLNWTSSGNMNTGRAALSGCGTQSAGLSIGGHHPYPTQTNITEKFNGYVWTNDGNLNTARYQLGGAGIQSAGLSFGGYTSTSTNVTEISSGTYDQSYYKYVSQ